MKELVLFTEEECKWLLSHATDYHESVISYDWERTPGLIRVKNYKDRISEQCELGQPEGPLAEFLLEKLKPLGFINLDGAFLNYVRYFKGGFFAKHIDGPERHKTCIIQLTPKEAYKGGDLIVRDKVVSKEVGTTVIFGSNVSHELTLLEEGYRNCLVVWTKKGNLIEKNTLI
jgi:hypothetical protein